jgi:tripartite-type tricarboxylate transporter receptor subunit TctC
MGVPEGIRLRQNVTDDIRAQRATIVVCTALFGLAAGNVVMAQNYPTKPIRLVVPFAPGGGTDIVARVIAQKATEALGQSVVVDNRAGGGGTVGAETAVRANPDGYTLGLVSTSYSTNPSLYKLPYDAVRDIQAIILIGETGYVVVLNPAVPIKSVKELIAYARANPGKLNYASTGTGGATHLATVLFELMAGTKMTHIPYKGTGPAVTDLIGGQIQVLIGAMPSTIPQVKGGRLRGVGVSTAKRISSLPDMPTVSESLPGYEAVTHYGILGPKGLPRNVVALWNREVARILQTEEMKARLTVEAIEPAGGPPEEFLNTIRSDVEKWGKVVKAAGITLGN